MRLCQNGRGNIATLQTLNIESTKYLCIQTELLSFIFVLGAIGREGGLSIFDISQVPFLSNRLVSNNHCSSTKTFIVL